MNLDGTGLSLILTNQKRAILSKLYVRDRLAGDN
jgi:hypothetical protein